LTGYRQSETTEPSSICAPFAILHLLACSGLATQARDAERTFYPWCQRAWKFRL